MLPISLKVKWVFYVDKGLGHKGSLTNQPKQQLFIELSQLILITPSMLQMMQTEMNRQKGKLMSYLKEAIHM